MEFRNHEAIYIQIANYISEQILLNTWAVEEKIPSVRDTAAALEVNPNTVMRSYDLLQQAAIIYNKRGIGFFVSLNAHELIKQQQKSEFMQEELPAFFRKIHLLNIPLTEILTQYDAYLMQLKTPNAHED